MLGWAISFMLAALIAAAIGFGGMAGTPAAVARILSAVFAILSAGTMIRRIARGEPPI